MRASITDYIERFCTCLCMTHGDDPLHGYIQSVPGAWLHTLGAY
jgi:hypothetical protein